MTNGRSLHALLEQTSWIHALARRLVADPHLAADLAQDTCVDALAARPDAERPLRGWLATVMRNRLAKLRRGEHNRTLREERASRGELESSTLEVVERAETHRNVVLAVLALEEPYRSTLLMRFFEQLSYDEIARRTGVTRAAVNSRITRGLAELRARLETTYGGDRRALCLALTPLAKLSPGVATTLLGAKIMHVAIGTAAATLLAVSVSVTRSDGERETSAPPALVAATTEPQPVNEELEQPLFAGRAPLAAETSEPASAENALQEKRQSEENVWKTELFHAQLVPATVESLAVNATSGDIEVLRSASGQLEIQAKVSAKLGVVPNHELTQIFEDHVDVFEEEGVLHIEDKHRDSRGWSVSFVARVPGELPLTANSGSGDIVVRHAPREVQANTGSGDVRVDLFGERVQALVANTGSGDVVIEVSAVEEKLAANTGSGDVVMRVVERDSPGGIGLNSGSGDIQLVVVPGVSGTFDLETSGEDIVLPRELGIEVKREAGGLLSARGSVGNGGGTYRLRSGSGELKVELGNALPTEPR